MSVIASVGVRSGRVSWDVLAREASHVSCGSAASTSRTLLHVRLWVPKLATFSSDLMTLVLPLPYDIELASNTAEVSISRESVMSEVKKIRSCRPSSVS